MCGEVRGASPEGHSTGRGQGAAIAAQCRFLDAGNEKTTDALIGGLSIGRRRNGVLVMSKPRMAFVVALGIAAALLGVSAFSTPAAAANNVSFTLFGSRAGGWGLTNTTVTSPGPALTVHVGDNVTLNLTSLDAFTHRWFIDYNGNNVSNGAEPTSPNFGTALLWNFTVSNVTGTFRYRSDRTGGPGDDLSTMWGNITILAAQTTPPPLLPGGENTVLIVAGVIVIIVAVIAFAAFFWRRMGKPGTPPPPPQ